jgi:hypothetical protein
MVHVHPEHRSVNIVPCAPPHDKVKRRKGGKEERRKGGKEERRKGGKEERRKGN